ncbi:carbohydrate ABC transporter permease [bacterium]|nr:carbohydrate ABC transporter permease [bacterium]
MPPKISLSLLSLVNFVNLFERGQIFRWFFNSFYIACFVTMFNLFFSSLAGYTLAKKIFPGRKAIFWMIISTMMIPGQVTLVPVFIMMTNFGLLDTHAALILPQVVSVFSIFLMKQYIQTLPSELEDAARIDGCSEFGVFWRIILPLCRPVLAVLGIFVFVANWNNFLWPLIMLNTPSKFTMQVGLATLQEQFATDYGILMAGAAFAAVPMIIMFLSLQRHFIKGLTIGGVKG